MVLSNPEQLDAFEQKPEEGEMSESSLLEWIAESTRELALKDGIKHEDALKKVLEALRVQNGWSEKETAEVRDEFVDYRLKTLIKRTEESAEKKLAARRDEHTGEVFMESKPPAQKPSVHTSGEHPVHSGPHEEPEGWLAKWEREHDR